MGLNLFNLIFVLSFLVGVGQEEGVLLVHSGLKDVLLPQVRGEVSVGLGDGIESGFGEVSKSGSGTTSTGVHVLNSSESQQLLCGRGGDDTGSSGGRDQTDTSGTSLTVDLFRNGVRLTDLVTPITTTNGDQGKLGVVDGTTDGVGDFLGALNAQTDVTVRVSDNYEGLEAGSLTGTGLLLDRHNLHYLKESELFLRRKNRREAREINSPKSAERKTST